MGEEASDKKVTGEGEAVAPAFSCFAVRLGTRCLSEPVHLCLIVAPHNNRGIGGGCGGLVERPTKLVYNSVY